MTEASHSGVFVDRRSHAQRAEGLATQILFWYDADKKKRRRINGVAVTTDGHLFVARSTCSKKDQFVKSFGRMIIEQRMFGSAQRHCWKLVPYYVGQDTTTPFDHDKMAEACALVYADEFPEDEKGHKRAYNAGKIYTSYHEEMERRANELDEFDG